MIEPPLQPLRIPANWTISYNSFREVDPSSDVSEYLCEDLFQAKCPVTNVLVDLGWYPDGDPAGCFVIEAYIGDFLGQRLRRIEAPTRAEATRCLEHALLEFHFAPPAP
ncbi:MAG: hypothetical protein HOW73_49045 [Polyangiaceae bacterium]|nr:hypothetical protein [Polyangiaceae bacterium]